MISEDDVKHVAGLSRIHLRDEEVPKLTKNLEDILEYVNKLEKLDISQVEPTSHVIPMANVDRPDEVKPSLSQDESLSIAVDKASGSFKVPKVIE